MRKKDVLFVMFFCFLLVTPVTVSSQDRKTTEKSEFWGKSDEYLQRQAFRMFDLVDEALTANPPVPGAPMIRKLALYNLDALLHDTGNDNGEPLNKFIETRLNRVIADLSLPVKKGMKVYKIYNEGIIARTKTVTVAFDLARGICQGKTLLPDRLIHAIVEKSDILLITHNHNDHADRGVVEMFLDLGKPVIAPANFWEENDKILHLRSEKTILKKMNLGEGKDITVRIFPGHQDDLMNNLYVVTTAEGKTMAHVGDQYNKEDLKWIAGIKEEIPQPDVLLVNCWTHNMSDLIDGFNPKIVLTGHENEMGHTIDHREAFWLTFQKMEKINRKYMVMSWGEWFLCR